MHTKPTIRLNLVILVAGVILALLFFAGYFTLALGQSQPSTTDSLIRQNDLLQRAVQAMRKQAKVDPLRDPEMEINGLIISQTLTKIGADFYDLFYQRWSAPSSAGSYEIRIEELPVPGFGTLIVVKVN